MNNDSDLESYHLFSSNFLLNIIVFIFFATHGNTTCIYKVNSVRLQANNLILILTNKTKTLNIKYHISH